MSTNDRKITSMSESEKVKAMRVVGRELDKLDRQHGETVVRYVVNRRHEERLERQKLQEEKTKLEARLAEIGEV